MSNNLKPLIDPDTDDKVFAILEQDPDFREYLRTKGWTTFREYLESKGWTQGREAKPALAPWPWRIIHQEPQDVMQLESWVIQAPKLLSDTPPTIPCDIASVIMDEHHARFIVAMRWLKYYWDKKMTGTVGYNDMPARFEIVCYWMKTVTEFMETGDMELLK